MADKLKKMGGNHKGALLALFVVVAVVFAVLGAQSKTLLSLVRKSEGEAPVSDAFKKYGQEFEGVINKSYADSKEWWPETPKPAVGTPNVLVIMLDDVGYAQLGPYGGLISTPNIDKLAANGLTYTNFHTPALCTPSRAGFMAGRNTHRIGLGSHSLTAMGFPGYNAIIPDSARSFPVNLEKAGFVTYALGKWDDTPLYEVSTAGPFRAWPSGDGFQHFYGFMAADSDNYRPVMYSDHTPTENWVGKSDFHLTTDMADRAIENVTAAVSAAPDRPFFMYFATSAMHSPHQVGQKYIDMYAGKFDMGWDKAREEIHKKQLALGILPPGTLLSARTAQLPAWESLTAEEKKVYARQMEVFAGMLTQTDEQIGRIIATLERTGRLDNTMVIVTSDNGASGEGGLHGTPNEAMVINGIQATFEQNAKYYGVWGGADTYPHYHAGWALAGNTPFQYFKQSVHNGGIADPLIISWPKGIQDRGKLRTQYSFTSDIAPTILEATGTAILPEVDGVKQMDLDGISLAYSFNDASASSRRTEQYYEQFGNRAIFKDGWKAVVIHGPRMPWDTVGQFPFENEKWELYHIDEDFSESVDLAGKYPDKLKELQARWEELAWENNVYPLDDGTAVRIARLQDRLFGDQKVFTYYWPGAVRMAEKTFAPTKDRSHTIATSVNLTGNEEGVIVACGGFTGGYTMYIQNHRLNYDYNSYNNKRFHIETPPLPTGAVDLKFVFKRTGLAKGTGELYVNGAQVGRTDMEDMLLETDMEEMHLSTFSLSESCDIGVDNGAPVSKKYQVPDHFPFTGALDKVVITLTADDEDRSNDTDNSGQVD